MGVVYEAEDLELGRRVAVKFLPQGPASSADALERFRREARVASALNHPHICTVYDVGTHDGQPFLVMERLEGHTLKHLIGGKALPTDRILTLGEQIADALDAAHRAGIVHRDLKPANLFVTERGEAKVLDFGLAKMRPSAPGGTTDPEAPTEFLTEAGITLGTVAYMSPEQARSEEVDARSDLFSLGVVLFEMATGQLPFAGRSTGETYAAILRSAPPSPGDLNPDLPDALEAIVLKALEKDVALRYQSAADLRADLERLRRGESGQAPAVTRAPASSRTTRNGLAAAALVIVAAAGYWVYPHLNRTDSTSALRTNDQLVAVMPFTIRGSQEFAYLGEGVVDLVSARLDGAGGLTAVNPRAVIARANRRGMNTSDPASVRQMASELGAGRVLSGSLVEAGGRIQLIASLDSSEDTGVAPVSFSEEGGVDDLFEVVDRLVLGVLAGSMPESEARLQRLGPATTTSVPALKEYLEGERMIRAGGKYAEASAAYDRAIAIDPTFALAYYRKSMVAEWIDAYDVRSSAEQALEHADRLSRRDRSLLGALLLRRQGRTTEAEQAYRAHLHTWPDEVEALVQLGELFFHDNPRKGRSMNEAIPVFEQAVALEPSNADARIHLARLYALNGQTESLAETVRHFEQDAGAIAPEEAGSERLFEVQALQAYTTGDLAAQQDLERRLKGLPWPNFFFAAHGVSRFARNPAGAQAILAGRSGDEPLLLMLVANLYQVRGQHRQFLQLLDQPPGGRTAQWDLLEAFVWTSGAAAPETARMEAALDRLRRADPANILRDDWVPAYEDLTVDFHAFERDYNVALLLVHLGRAAEARQIITSLKARAKMQALGTVQEDAVLSLEAELLEQDGRSIEALAVLRTIAYETPHSATYRAVVDGSRSRFLRAELELAHGDRAVAKALYQGFDESWSPWDLYHRPIVYERLAQIAEAEERPSEAVELYGRLLDLWRDCDPDLVARRDDIRQRRDALTAKAGRRP